MHPYLIPILKTLANSNSSCNCSWPGSVVTFLKRLLLMGVKLWNGFCRVVEAITGRRHPRLLIPPPPLSRFYIVISWSEVQHTQADSKHRSDIWGSIPFIHKYKIDALLKSFCMKLDTTGSLISYTFVFRIGWTPS